MTAEPWAVSLDAADASAERREEVRSELLWLVERNPRWALLSTCHRVELYGFGRPPVLNHMREHRGEATVRRLMRIAAGLESASVGEDEVLHQVRHSLEELLRRRPVEHKLIRLMEVAVAQGRRARSQRRPRGPGLAVRAVDWLSTRAKLAGAPVLVAGAGVMGTALKDALCSAGVPITIASRTPRPGVVGLAEAARVAPYASALAVALSGPWEELAAHATLPPTADLSAPAAVPAAVRAALGPDYLGVDQLFSPSSDHSAWVDRAEQVVEEGVSEYLRWLRGRESVGTLRALRERAEVSRQARLERLLRRLPDLAERDRELIVALSRQLVTDLLHEPISSLREDCDGSAAAAAQKLFRL